MSDLVATELFSNSLPLLISRNLVVFPNSKNIIEIGRECSLASIKCSISDYKGEIVVVAQKDYDVDFPLPSDLYKVGTLCKVTVLKQNKDESLTVEVEGFQRVKVSSVKLVKLAGQEELGQMWISEYELLKEKNTSLVKNRADIDQLFKYFEELFEVEGEDYTELKKLFSTDEAGKGSDLDSCSVLIDKLCSIWPQNEKDGVDVKQKWLEELNLTKRISLMLDYEYLSEAEKDEINSSITKKVNKNISKQQREFYLRERIKVIKEELGESVTRDGELQKFKEWLKKEKAPEHIRNRVQEEVKKLEYSGSISTNESLIIHNYLNWIISLPWSKSSKDQKNVWKVKEELNKNHFGLEKVKERILEHVSVQKRTKNPQGTIICLVGPPGVGKTSLAQSIAKGLNKVCIKISLGGMSDEAEIRGHRRTYVGSLPGKIIQSLKKAKVNNPVILLDEIDKVASHRHGDPFSALLEVLDPKQNKQFSDNYIEEEVDLSKIMFIATANYEEEIPDALSDRLEMIRLSSYTEKEKLEIARNSLVAEVLAENGLKPEELVFDEDSLRYIIQRYTREPGVRALKQVIARIARKFVMKQEENKDLTAEVLNEEKIRGYLGKEDFDVTIKDTTPVPGRVNGMAYTASGGDLLPVEVNIFPAGKGELSRTGNLKETIVESVEVAKNYIRKNSEAFNLKDIKWTDLDIHLHVPQGGVPKDGPSAGVTIATALLSELLQISIPSEVAMTGEITTKGIVEPIGGLKEKILSAVRGGVNTVFFPKKNEKDLEDIPKDVLEKITLKPVEYYTEIFDELFASKLIISSAGTNPKVANNQYS
ncbi:ATP-dependent protease La [Candidatus Mycoplasma haematolamae str. Purdue]|uniref:Lon protease n=1 Tax=Mycoplasma haematolamae (strain Purdue) TaxID=1212765 RepID=I7C5K7_MYCHA|nr:endopeptidase La [Candidatus Mycoplasma haematolamae]AFO51792.1 ATP-dependent protease La [Candidatus Mycoplasma haematolamae str. Purdue]